jgi:hypothetical protein
MMLKENLANYLLGFIILFYPLLHDNKVYDLINVIIDDFNIQNMSHSQLIWKDFGYINYNDLKHTNDVTKEKNTLNIDELFDEDQIAEINKFLESPSRIRIKEKYLNNKIQGVNESTDRSNLGIIYSFSSPIMLKGKDGREFGIILISSSFFGEGTVQFLVYENKNECWTMLYQRLIRFS